MEYVYHITKNNKVIKKVSRDEMRKKKLMHRSIGVIIHNKEGEIMIQKRTATKDVFPNYYDVMLCGTVRYGESYDKCAKREIAEEIGAKNTKPKFLFKSIYDGKDNKTVYYIYSLIFNKKPHLQKEEVKSYKYVTMTELKKLMKTKKFCPDSKKAFMEYLEAQKWKKNT